MLAFLNKKPNPKAKPSWWRWENFEPYEIWCKCKCMELWKDDTGKPVKFAGSATPKPPQWFYEAMDALQRLRDRWGPIYLTSAHRCTDHNRIVGGVSNSEHTVHIAFDVRVSEAKQDKFVKLAKQQGFKFCLKYPTRNFVHIDMKQR